MNGVCDFSFDQKISFFNTALKIDDNFDIIYRTINIGGRKACIYFIDAFVKDDIMQKILEYFSMISMGNMPDNAHDFLQKRLPYVELDYTSDNNTFCTSVLSGMTGLVIDGFDEYILIDCRTYPARGIEEPAKDKVMRGSRDGFVETMIMNIGLIRRRIRSCEFSTKVLTVGNISKTDIAVCYMNDRVDKKFLDSIITRISAIKTDSLNMNQESLAECLQKGNKGILWHISRLNPFPKFKYSERPDTAAASLIEGHVIILVDNSPAAMIIPTSIFDIAEEADDFYFPPITGNYLRLSRFIITLLSFFLTPLYLYYSLNPDVIPQGFEFIKLKETANIPILLQLLILEISIDGLKLAAVNTPSMLSTPLSVIAGIVIGDFAVSSGWFNAESLLYMAFVAFAGFTNGSFELGYAIKLHRILTLFLVSFFGLWGIVAGSFIIIMSICTNKTISNKLYISVNSV